jgi:hypothetical protein
MNKAIITGVVAGVTITATGYIVPLVKSCIKESILFFAKSTTWYKKQVNTTEQSIKLCGETFELFLSRTGYDSIELLSLLEQDNPGFTRQLAEELTDTAVTTSKLKTPKLLTLLTTAIGILSMKLLFSRTTDTGIHRGQNNVHLAPEAIIPVHSDELPVHNDELPVQQVNREEIMPIRQSS